MNEEKEIKIQFVEIADTMKTLNWMRLSLTGGAPT